MLVQRKDSVIELTFLLKKWLIFPQRKDFNFLGRDKNDFNFLGRDKNAGFISPMEIEIHIAQYVKLLLNINNAHHSNRIQWLNISTLSQSRNQNGALKASQGLKMMQVYLYGKY